ncbi:MAG TPA: cupredoxin domain-containing protein [Actinocrinis sp.]|nr:cupredoxin domain-containing protein [Actinocrinis sp.]
MRRRTVVSVSTALLLAGCSSSSTAAPASSNPAASAPASAASVAPAAADTIVIKNFAFAPASLTVAPGAKVTVTNDDTVAHTVTATGSKAFDTGDIGGGKTVTFTAPSADGSYAYICSIHQYMQGTLIVK